MVPTYDRIDDLRRLIDAVRAQTQAPDELIVVDNGSSEAIGEYLRAQADVTAIRPEGNLGAPGGFERGMRTAFERGADWAWLLDDDCVPDPNALERLADAVTGDGERHVGGVAPTVEFGDGRRETGWRWGARADGGRGQSPNVPDSAGGAPHGDVDWAPFAGLLLARRACVEAGAIRADYFLWHADVEYCLRLRSRGWRLLAVPGATVRHPAMPLVKRTMLGRTLGVGRIPAWREYYDVRNRCLLLRDLHGTELTYGEPLRRRAWRELKRTAAVLAVDRAGPQRVWMRLLGLFDGLRGRTDRRPELSGS